MQQRLWDSSKSYTRIKLCEFESLDAAYEASFIGADFLGFHIFSDQAYFEKANRFNDFFQYLPPFINKTLLTDIPLNILVELLDIVKVDSIQLYNDSSREDILQLKKKFSAIKIIKVMSEKSEENFTSDDNEFIQRYDDIVDAFLLDSFRIGGTGVTGDWKHCAEIVKKCQSPVFLAGGLTADNVYEAIKTVRPFGVDVENGVSDVLAEGFRVKNMQKCRLFVEKVKEADWKIKRSFYSEDFH